MKNAELSTLQAYEISRFEMTLRISVGI